MRQRSTPRERMEEFLRQEGISAYEFENKCGIGHGFVKRVSREITHKIRERIKAVYPNLNMEYIARGVGTLQDSPGSTKETMKERLLQFLHYQNVNRNRFTKLTGVSSPLLSNMSGSLRSDSREKIYRAFPMLNPEWLEYGEGNMILDVPKERSEDSVEERMIRLIEFLGITKTKFMSETDITSNFENVTNRTIEKIVKRYPFINPLWIQYGYGNMYYSKPLPNLAFAPFVSKDNYTNYQNFYNDEEFIDRLIKVPYIENAETSGSVIAFEISGDKMNNGMVDSYVDGDWVLCRELSVFELFRNPEVIEHYDFVIIREDGVHVRKILNCNIDKACITIHCLNNYYSDEEIGLNDIKKLFLVIKRESNMKR